MKKVIIVSFSLLFFTSLLFPQSLAELAKKERERREKLKGKKVVAVTNADLGKSIKREAVSIAEPEILAGKTEPEITPPETSSPEEELISIPGQEDEKTIKEQRASFELKWNKAKEYADLLAMKINGLWQEFYSQDDMNYRERTQQEISETFLQLQKAREDEAKAKEELDQFLAQARKRGVPPGWLR